ncbi:MAG: hypothetical protein A2286_02655 [Gammaproteobacteria bacterium RIFOXYA12_FULL_61_12]|nr:MAG: hypothetical protein A2514_00355 [Gammaproteobacteria bacterium RIFOXYD12_FULL_61_37]OGT93170.1 MAG: hypothetical protein A2286_02655 [Gammaproteobacteria bacterium RIFOXYA12_FULL_61_12]
MISLEQRLRRSLAWSLLLLMGLLGLGGGYAIDRMTREFVASRLAHDAEALLAALEPKDGGFALNERALVPVYQQPYSGHYYLLLDRGASLRSRSLWDWNLDLEPLPAGKVRLAEIPGPDGQRLLLRVGGFSKQGMAITLALAEDLNPIRHWRRLFEWGVGLMALLGLAAMLWVQRTVLRNAFSPLDGLRREMRALERGERDSLSEEAPSEVRPLVVEFNRLLTSLGQRIIRSRNAAGNLAHALKGPLNLLYQEIGRGKTADRERLRGYAEEIGRLMDRELRRAKLAGGGAPGRRFAPREELPLLFELFGRLYGERCPRFDLQCPEGLQLPLDREDMLEMLGNLLDNACKWATGRVAVRLESGPAFRLRVEDDGPGVSPAGLESLAQRGLRLDETVEGHGLGLAIVRELVELYEGTIHFDCAGELGGLRVVVELPLPLPSYPAMLF